MVQIILVFHIPFLEQSTDLLAVLKTIIKNDVWN